MLPYEHSGQGVRLKDATFENNNNFFHIKFYISKNDITHFTFPAEKYL